MAQNRFIVDGQNTTTAYSKTNLKSGGGITFTAAEDATNGRVDITADVDLSSLVDPTPVTFTQTYSTTADTIVAPTTDSTGGASVAAAAAGVGIEHITIPLTSLATGLSTAAIDLLTNYTPGYKFKLLGLDFVTTVAGTGSSASQVFNLEIGTTNVTGGVLTLALADTDTIGKVTSATAITAANTGSSSATISLEMASGGTVFTAGAGYFILRIQNMDVADAFTSLIEDITLATKIENNVIDVLQAATFAL